MKDYNTSERYLKQTGLCGKLVKLCSALGAVIDTGFY